MERFELSLSGRSSGRAGSPDVHDNDDDEPLIETTAYESAPLSFIDMVSIYLFRL